MAQTTHLYLLSIALVMLAIFPALGNRVDSLNTALSKADARGKVEIFLQLSREYESSDPGYSLTLSMDAESEAYGLSDWPLIGKAKRRIGVAHYYLDDYETASAYYFEALNIFDSLAILPEKAKSLNNIGWNYKVSGDLDEAIIFLNQALDIATNVNDPELLQGVMNNLGTVYRLKAEPMNAFNIYKQSLELNRAIGNRRWEAFNLNNLGLVNIDLKQYDSALYFFSRAKDINHEQGNLPEYAKNLLNIGLAHHYLGHGARANYFMQLADSMILAQNLKKEQLTYFDYMEDIHADRGDFREALKFQKAFSQLEKELNFAAANEKIVAIRARYEMEEKVRELDRTKAQLNQHRFIIFIGSTMFLLVLALLILIARMLKAKNAYATQIESLNRSITRSAEEIKHKNEEIQRMNQDLEAIVEDRTKELQDQNEKLVRYAFINSHEIRGPMARVLGLVYLLRKDKENQINFEALAKLEKAAQELDAIIKESGSLLQEKQAERETE